MKQLVQTRNLRCQKQFEQYRQWTYNVMLRRAFVQPLLQWNSETHYTNCVCVFERFFLQFSHLLYGFYVFLTIFHIYFTFACMFLMFFYENLTFSSVCFIFFTKNIHFFLLFYHIYQMHDFMLFD